MPKCNQKAYFMSTGMKHLHRSALQYQSKNQHTWFHIQHTPQHKHS